jgi:hypothetical protein
MFERRLGSLYGIMGKIHPGRFSEGTCAEFGLNAQRGRLPIQCLRDGVVGDGELCVGHIRRNLLGGDELAEGDRGTAKKCAPLAELRQEYLYSVNRIGWRRNQHGGRWLWRKWGLIPLRQAPVHLCKLGIRPLLSQNHRRVRRLNGNGVMYKDDLIRRPLDRDTTGSRLGLGRPPLGQANASGSIGIVKFGQGNVRSRSTTGLACVGRRCRAGQPGGRGHELFPFTLGGIGPSEDDGNLCAAVLQLDADDSADDMPIQSAAEGGSAPARILGVLIGRADRRPLAEIDGQVRECRFQSRLHRGNVGFLRRE